ncbi:hypothetical protein [Streptomyces sediminimaris]|uniref:hypothetical protein n=1 Tax=Streptomyces sediminimaris TaxID=3383721 RepID=UPI00399A7712
MPDLTTTPPGRPTPPLPEPSYARVVVERIADQLEQPGDHARLLQDAGLRRAFNTAAAEQLHALPTAVAGDTADKVAALLPDRGAATTHGQYARRLRELARAV